MPAALPCPFPAHTPPLPQGMHHRHARQHTHQMCFAAADVQALLTTWHIMGGMQRFHTPVHTHVTTHRIANTTTPQCLLGFKHGSARCRLTSPRECSLPAHTVGAHVCNPHPSLHVAVPFCLAAASEGKRPLGNGTMPANIHTPRGSHNRSTAPQHSPHPRPATQGRTIPNNATSKTMQAQQLLVQGTGRVPPRTPAQGWILQSMLQQPHALQHPPRPPQCFPTHAFVAQAWPVQTREHTQHTYRHMCWCAYIRPKVHTQTCHQNSVLALLSSNNAVRLSAA